MEHRDILKNRTFLYVTEFFSGMSVMAVELGASRLLAPYFSSSQIVWTIIIGTIMIAMALGNMWGGRQADKDPNTDKLFKRILIAAVWIAAIPLFGKYVIMGISALVILSVNSNYLAAAAFASCMIVFVFPLFLLGTVTPSLAKYCVRNTGESGKIVGTLEACSTIGSILGTFLPTFVTIPTVGTAVTFLIFSGVLLAISLIYFISRRTKKTMCIAASVVFIICSIFGNSDSFAFWRDDIDYEGESVYNYLQVTEDDSSVVLSTNVLFGVQSIYMKSDTLTGMYYDYALAAPVLAGYEDRDSTDILVLGMGCGTYAQQCSRYFPKSSVEGVEIDSKIIWIAREYFNLPDSVKVTEYDGRAFLEGTDKKYDVIMVDAYQDITIPFQMSSVEFFNEVKSHLTEGGVMVVNMNMHNDAEGSINEYLCDTIASVFPEVYTVDVEGSTNRELFAFESADQLGNLTQSSTGHYDLDNMLGTVSAGLVKYEGGDHILTDDKAPVERLGMKAMDSIIENEVSYYKGIIEEKGLKELLNELLG
ncbi:MAG: spermidine synthase [Oscillospiraceae bacterium]